MNSEMIDGPRYIADGLLVKDNHHAVPSLCKASTRGEAILIRNALNLCEANQEEQEMNSEMIEVAKVREVLDRFSPTKCVNNQLLNSQVVVRAIEAILPPPAEVLKPCVCGGEIVCRQYEGNYWVNCTADKCLFASPNCETKEAAIRVSNAMQEAALNERGEG